MFAVGDFQLSVESCFYGGPDFGVEEPVDELYVCDIGYTLEEVVSEIVITALLSTRSSVVTCVTFTPKQRVVSVFRFGRVFTIKSSTVCIRKGSTILARLMINFTTNGISQLVESLCFSNA